MNLRALLLLLTCLAATPAGATDAPAPPAIMPGEHEMLAATLSENPQLAPNADATRVSIHMMGDHASMGGHDTTTMLIGILLMIAMMVVMM